MKNKILAFVVMFSLCIYSCKKHKKETEMEPCNHNSTQTTYPNYSCLKVGNYWVYQRFEIDTVGGAEHPLAIMDSCYIEKDTVINSKIYYKYVSPSLVQGMQLPKKYDYLRDSLGYIVRSSGAIIFSSTDFSSIFLEGYQINPTPVDTLYHYVHKMADQNIAVNTPAGNFVTSNYRETYYMYHPYDGGGKIRNRNTRYAQNIGRVIEGFYLFANQPKYQERRLARYHVN